MHQIALPTAHPKVLQLRVDVWRQRESATALPFLFPASNLHSRSGPRSTTIPRVLARSESDKPGAALAGAGRNRPAACDVRPTLGSLLDSPPASSCPPRP